MSLETFRFCPRCAKPLADRAITDIEGIVSQRRACDDACGFIQWMNPVPVVGALVEHEGEMVLARNQGWPEGWFALVTGYLEPNEDPVKGVEREVKEELGLEADSVHLIGNYIFERKNEVVMCYHVVASGTVTLGRELAEVRRHKPAELRPWRRATGLAVADWMKSRGLEVRWDERAALKSEPTRT